MSRAHLADILPEPEDGSTIVLTGPMICGHLVLHRDDADAFTVVVELVGIDRWAVKHNGASLSADGMKSWGWDWENGREPVTHEEHEAAQALHDAWLTEHRFDEQTALRIAREYAPKIRIRDYTVADALADQDRQEGR